jgi:hypothetical protein
MSKISKTAAASIKGAQMPAKVDPFDTNEKKIKELRNQRRDKLAVGRFDFIDALIEEFDKVQLLLAQEIANVVVAKEAHAAAQKINVTLLNMNEKLNGQLNQAILQRDNFELHIAGDEATMGELRKQIEDLKAMTVSSTIEAAVTDGEMMAADAMTSEGGHEPTHEN